MSKKKASFVDDSTTPKRVQSKVPPGKPTKTEPPPQAGAPADQMVMMMQMMQNMMSGMMGTAGQQWSSAVPFQPEQPEEVSHEVVFPETLERGIVAQEALDIHPLYGKLFLKMDGGLLGGIPKGCTITITGPPYIGKTRSAMEMMTRALMKGMKVAYVVAEEGFYDETDSGRNDLFSRFLELASAVSGVTEKQFRSKYDKNYVIIPNQYHLGKTWADFIRDYRYVVEELGIKFILIDSINMLDPSKLNTVENLNALKTYNHSKGVTAVVLGQIKDTGLPQGGEALFHTSEVSIHFFTRSMGSNEEAAKWGAKYRDQIPMITARSKVCGSLSFPVKILQEPEQGLLRPDPAQPPEHEFPANFWKQDEPDKKPATKKAPAKKASAKKSKKS